jgi:hypothetical protein
MPSPATRAAQYGWSAIWGTTTCGARPGRRRRRARAAVVHHGGHPAEQLLLVDLADDEAVVDVVDRGQAGPAAGEDDTAALRPDRLDGHPGDVLRDVRGHAAEAHVHRRRAGIQERLQPLRERTVVGQDPRPGLHDVEVGHALRRTQDRVRGQPRLVGEDVVATLSTGGRPIAARWLLSASPYKPFTRWASCSHSTGLSVSSRGDGGRRCVGGSPLLGQAGRMRRREVRTSLPSSSFAGFRFPPEVITVAVRWYLRYALSYRDVESCWQSAESPSITSRCIAGCSGFTRC